MLRRTILSAAPKEYLESVVKFINANDPNPDPPSEDVPCAV